jgi:hypothetical protein
VRGLATADSVTAACQLEVPMFSGRKLVNRDATKYLENEFFTSLEFVWACLGELGVFSRYLLPLTEKG